jgi:hypothetical protein
MIRGNEWPRRSQEARTMKVLLTLYGDETLKGVESPEDIARTMQAWGEFGEAAAAAGVLLVCDALEAAQTATTVRVDAGSRHVTDGPFIETKEQLGGVILLEVRDLDEAMEWAERTPWNGEGCVTEIRPVMDYDAYAARAGITAEGTAAN